jgi:hypothetical protein
MPLSRSSRLHALFSSRRVAATLPTPPLAPSVSISLLFFFSSCAPLALAAAKTACCSCSAESSLIPLVILLPPTLLLLLLLSSLLKFRPLSPLGPLLSLAVPPPPPPLLLFPAGFELGFAGWRRAGKGTLGAKKGTSFPAAAADQDDQDDDKDEEDEDEDEGEE